jgi:hypothetical protein
MLNKVSTKLGEGQNMNKLKGLILLTIIVSSTIAVSALQQNTSSAPKNNQQHMSQAEPNANLTTELSRTQENTNATSQGSSPEAISNGSKPNASASDNKEQQGITAFLSILLSIIAIIISLKSLSNSSNALKLEQEKFERDQLIVLKGKLTEGNDRLLLEPLGESIAVQQAVVVFPDELDSERRLISGPSYDVPLFTLRYALEKFLSSKVTVSENHAAVNLGAIVPLIIDCNYTVKGNSRSDRSVYYIDFSYVINYNELPRIDFKGLIFGQRIAVTNEPKTVVGQIWSDLKDRITEHSNLNDDA